MSAWKRKGDHRGTEVLSDDLIVINIASGAYADMILNGDPEAYLRNVTEYKPMD